MGNIAIEWSLEGIKLMKLVKMTGTIKESITGSIKESILNCIPTQYILRLLLVYALEVVEEAEKNKGFLIPLSKPPIKKNQNFVYFEIIFKSVADYDTFLEAIKNKLSQ